MLKVSAAIILLSITSLGYSTNSSTVPMCPSPDTFTAQKALGKISVGIPTWDISYDTTSPPYSKYPKMKFVKAELYGAPNLPTNSPYPTKYTAFLICHYQYLKQDGTPAGIVVTRYHGFGSSEQTFAFRNDISIASGSAWQELLGAGNQEYHCLASAGNTVASCYNDLPNTN